MWKSKIVHSVLAKKAMGDFTKQIIYKTIVMGNIYDMIK